MGTTKEAAAYDVIYLVGCAVNSIVPDLEQIKAMNPKGVYAKSRFFGLSALTWYALESAFETEEEKNTLNWDLAVLSQWKEECDRAFIRSVRFEREREKVYSFLVENGIWYMPLKGIVLQNFYPEPYLREMVDNDILFDVKYREQVHRWFLNQGYIIEDYRVGNCDAYHKKPIYNFEMHVTLFAYFEEKMWRAYNETISERLIPDEKVPCRCHFSDEDFYVHLILHWYKHYKRSGIGIGSLMDCYLYTKTFGERLDWEYIQSELAYFGAVDYEKRMSTLSGKLFADPESFSKELLNVDEKEWLEEFLNSGIHGTVENWVRKGITSAQQNQKSSVRVKIYYVWQRLFPSSEYITTYAPIFAKYKWLIPVGYVYRIVRGCRKHGKELRSEIKIIRKM